MPSDTPASNPLQRGYVPFGGDAAQFHGWFTLMSSVMYESDLGNVMHGDETAPAALEEDATSAATTAYRKALHKFKEKNGKVFTRLLLATSDCPEGYSSPASQVVQSHGPIGARNSVTVEVRSQLSKQSIASRVCTECSSFTMSLLQLKSPPQTNSTRHV